MRHFMGTSTFAEYTVMPEIALAKIDPVAKLETVSMLAGGATTGLAAVLWKTEVEAGSTCAVFGCGMVGLGAVLGCAMQGAERIIAVDLSEERLELAKAAGATDTIGANQNPVDHILEITDGFGADYTFEATGLVKVMGQAVEAARMGWGTCTVLGVAGKGEALEIIPRLLITGRKVQGGSFGGARGRTHVPLLVDLYVQGKLDLDPFISHRLTLDQVNEGFDLMEAQDGIRSVIVFDAA
jgi:S-(hydroxymethyl)glutathione dehydrogenase/alcohol dehydrogenase